MNKKNLILFYSRSTLNIILSVTTIILIAGSTLLLEGLFKALIPICLFILYIITTIIILTSRYGAKGILNEQEEDRVKKVKKIITQYREMRDRISFLRIGDEDLHKSIEYFLLVSGQYFNKCREVVSYSPEANRKIEEVLQVCQIYLEEYDERLIEKKYNVEDDENFMEYNERAINTIKDAAEIIKKKIKNDFSDLTSKEKFEIIEEMNKEI